MLKLSIGKHGWTITGRLSDCKRFYVKQKFCRKDIITGSYSVVDGDFKNEKPATEKECKKLECAAVWSPGNVENRLRDVFINNNRQIPRDE